MAVKKLNIEFANFIFHMGSQNLLDCFVDFVHPALFDGFSRKHDETTYFFHNIKLIDVEIKGEVNHFVYGRLVKNGVLHQEQIVNGENLVPVDNVYPNAPSSIFILSLSNHRLFLIKEHRDAPTTDTLRTTVLHFVKQQRNLYINDLYDANRIQREERGGNLRNITKTALRQQYPEPELDIISMSSDADISEFVNTLSSIDTLTLDIIKPNNEADLSPIFDTLRDVGTELGAKKNKLTFQKGDRKTLKHEKVTKLSKEASRDNNVRFSIKGKDINKDIINGTNEEFKLTVPLDEKFDTPKATALVVYNKFLELIEDGLIKQPNTGEPNIIKRKINSILTLVKRFSDD